MRIAVTMTFNLLMPIAYTITRGVVKSDVCQTCGLSCAAGCGIYCLMSIEQHFEVNREELVSAIIELNSMSPCDGVIMSREGKVKVGYEVDADFLCMLIPAGVLARRLTADGLASYSGKELKAWAEKYEIEPLQAIVDAACQGS